MSRPLPSQGMADGLAPAPRTFVALAASAGGPNALATILAGLEGVDAAILVVQHIQRQFVDGFLEWMGNASQLPVCLAEDGMLIRRGVVHVGPPETHLKLARNGRIRLDPQPETLYRPSADELFRSIAHHAAHEAVGVLLTGMGEDGAQGLLALRAEGGATIAQDEGTSLVYGMPRAAARLEAAGKILPLDQIAPAIRRVVRRSSP